MYLVVFGCNKPTYFVAPFEVSVGLQVSHLFLFHHHYPLSLVPFIFSSSISYLVFPSYTRSRPSLCQPHTEAYTLTLELCPAVTNTHTRAHTQINAISCTYHWANWYFSLTVMPLGHVNNYIIFSDVNAPVHIIFPLWWAFDPLPHPLVLGTLLHEPSWSTCLSLAALLFL